MADNRWKREPQVPGRQVVEHPWSQLHDTVTSYWIMEGDKHLFTVQRPEEFTPGGPCASGVATNFLGGMSYPGADGWSVLVYDGAHFQEWGNGRYFPLKQTAMAWALRAVKQPDGTWRAKYEPDQKKLLTRLRSRGRR